MNHRLKSVRASCKTLLRQKFSQFRLILNTVRYCPICGWMGRQFKPGGASNKWHFDSICPKCSSKERHRLAYMVAEKCVNLDCSNVLHVAPEKALSTYFQEKAKNYLSIDINPNKAMRMMDITKLELEDNSISLIWASHVLEHVPKDGDAILELYRVLSLKGIAFIQVPIWRTNTLEDPTISTPDERLEKYYQRDHVRLYGIDIIHRFEKVGFSSAVYRAQDFGPEIVLQYGLSFISTNEVFVSQKK